MNRLSIEGLALSYGDLEILKGIDLEALSSEITMILSPNGSGKTSLMHALIGMIPIKQGKVEWIDGDRKVEILKLSTRARAQYLALVTQNVSANIHCSVFEFVLFGFSAHLGWYQTPDPAMQKKALEMLERLGIYDLRDREFGQLSGGEKQLASLGRALLQESKILLLDEPTAWLDLKNQVIFFDLLRNEVKNRGLIALINIHDPYSVANYADRVYLLKDGRNLASGKPTSVLNADLLGQLYHLDMEVKWEKDTLAIKTKKLKRNFDV